MFRSQSPTRAAWSRQDAPKLVSCAQTSRVPSGETAG